MSVHKNYQVFSKTSRKIRKYFFSQISAYLKNYLKPLQVEHILDHVPVLGNAAEAGGGVEHEHFSFGRTLLRTHDPERLAEQAGRRLRASDVRARTERKIAASPPRGNRKRLRPRRSLSLVENGCGNMRRRFKSLPVRFHTRGGKRRLRLAVLKNNPFFANFGKRRHPKALARARIDHKQHFQRSFSEKAPARLPPQMKKPVGVIQKIEPNFLPSFAQKGIPRTKRLCVPRKAGRVQRQRRVHAVTSKPKMRPDRIKKILKAPVQSARRSRLQSRFRQRGKQTETPPQNVAGPSDEAAGKPLNDQS